MTIGQERVVGDRRERRRHRRALRPAAGRRFGAGAHSLIHGSCHLPKPSTSPSASAGPHEPGAYGRTGGGASSSGWNTRHVSSTPSCRVNRVLSPLIAASSSTSYGVGPSPPS